MSKKCAKCEKMVYPTEELKCLDKIWHKNCFKCLHCNLLLNMKNYKGFEKQPFCFAHYPHQKPTAVNNNPELLRIKENTKFQSNIKYHEDFEKSKGIFTSVADDPETKRILENSKNISQIKYHEEFDKNFKNKGVTTVVNDPSAENSTRFSSHKTPTERKHVANHDALPLHHNSMVINSAAAASADPKPRFFAKPSEAATDVAKRAHIGSNNQQRQIGSIADYDPLNYENQNLASSTSYSTSSSSDRQVKPRSVFSLANGQYPAQYAAVPSGHTNPPYNNNNNNNDEYISTQIAHLNSDIKTSVYKAIYDYDGKEDDELSFRDGDKFVNCERIDEGWMIGVHEKTGKHGMFPSNYAEPIDYF